MRPSAVAATNFVRDFIETIPLDFVIQTRDGFRAGNLILSRAQ